MIINGQQVINIPAESCHEVIYELFKNQFRSYADLMRLVDTVMPSASMLEEVKRRKAIEVGAELNLPKPDRKES
jgi:hypothetical protein